MNAKAKAKLFDTKYWLDLRDLLETAKSLMAKIGAQEFDDFNIFKDKVDEALSALKAKLSAPEKNAVLNAVSRYDETAVKVIKKVVKLLGDKLATLLEHLGCTQEQLPDFGYYPSGKTGEYITYESSTDLRDAESIPLTDQIHRYFLAEVKPQLGEAWINLDSTKIGYEVSFNKHFYVHKPLRSLDKVANDIIALEHKAERSR